jgi:FkbM family methyltransferase
MNTVQLHHFTLSIPDGHWLAPIRRDHPDYGENVGRLASVVEKRYPERGVIDIGANVGDTTAIVRTYTCMPILCIEGSDYYFETLRQNVLQLGPDIELEHAFVDVDDCAQQGAVTIERGTAFFRPNAAGESLVEFRKLESILAGRPRFQNAKLLKVDTDGMDGRILVGALDWLASARPVLFWEHDIGLDRSVGGPGLSVFDRLLEIGYSMAMIFDNSGEYIQTLSLSARQQLADLTEYLPGGEGQRFGYCDICAFHTDDAELCEPARQLEIETRRDRRK